ncbi:MAG: hypothetical protein KKD31_19375, partial [Bacteroidetes bacterium]|nr:hypothetical protein [Bacteroidota bacterium]
MLRIFIKSLLYLVSFILLLIISGYLLLRLPSVQQWLANKTASYLSSELNTEVSVGGVDVEWFLDIAIKDLCVKDQAGDTLLYTKLLIADVEDVWYKQKMMMTEKIELIEPNIQLNVDTLSGKMNVQFIADYFKSEPSNDTTQSKPWEIVVKNILIRDGKFSYSACPISHPSLRFNENNIIFTYLQLDIRDINILSDVINCEIKELSFLEHSGINLKSFSTTASISSNALRAKNLEIKIGNTSLSMDARINVPDFDFSDIFAIPLHANIKYLSLVASDLSPFIEGIGALNERIALSGEFKGKLSDLKTKNLKVHFGTYSDIAIEGQVTGLPDPAATFLLLDIKELVTSKSDLDKIRIPPFGPNNRIPLPAEIAKLGQLRLKGRFTGFLNDFVLNLDARSAIGMLQTDIKISESSNGEDLNYNGNLQLTEFNVGNITNSPDIGKVSMNATISGTGLKKGHTSGTINAVVQSAELKQYNYNNITINGDYTENHFNGGLTISDPNVYLWFQGKVDYAKKVPIYNFHMNVSNADLIALNLLKNDTIRSSCLSVNMDCNFSGDQIDDINGIINMEDVDYQQNDIHVDFEKLKLITNADEESRSFRLMSDIADCNVIGKFNFTDIGKYGISMLSHLLPSYKLDSALVADTSLKGNMHFDILLKQPGIATSLFMPSLYIAPKTTISGNFDAAENTLLADIRTDSVIFGDTRLLSARINMKSFGNTVESNGYIGSIVLGKSGSFDNVGMDGTIGNDTVAVSAHWKGDFPIRNSGEMAAYVDFSSFPNITLNLRPSELRLADSLWTLPGDSKIIFDSSIVIIRNLVLEHNDQKLLVAGRISKNPSDPLIVGFENFDIANITAFTESSGVLMEGILNGEARINDLYNTLTIKSDLKLSKFVLNENELGDASVKSSWDNVHKGVGLQLNIMRGSINMLDMEGYYYPLKEKENLDFDVKLKYVPLEILNDYMAGVLSNLRGRVSTEGNQIIKVTGSFDNPEIWGSVMLRKVNFLVDYLNVGYSFVDEVVLTPTSIVFDSLVINDSLGNIAVVNGNIKHNKFKDFELDISIEPKKLACLNT